MDSFHARIVRQDDRYLLLDSGSSSGTSIGILKLAPNDPKLLISGNLIQVGEVTIEVRIQAEAALKVSKTVPHKNKDDACTSVLNQTGFRLDAIRLKISAGLFGSTTLLDNISISALPQEFVIIAGVSGGGKSTLLRALSGQSQGQGPVLIDGINLAQHFDGFRSRIGYVPQDDVVHLNLTVEEALLYAAQLRMPQATRRERQQRVQETLEVLDMAHRKKVVIRRLSGGQRKRVSIGVEILTKPNLLLLDEATSGLDPGTELQIMKLLRTLADQGQTIFLITHATKNVTIADQVIFLAKGGKVAYIGPPVEAKEYFKVTDFDEIYDRVERQHSPKYWQSKYLDSPQYQEYVVERQQQLKPSKALPTPMSSSYWQQFCVLSQRNLLLLLRDKASLFLMLAIAPIVGSLDLLLWRRDLLSSKSGDPGQSITMLFVTVMISVIVGCLSTMREIVKESEIYRREKNVGLDTLPYLGSKLSFALILAVYQSGFFLLFKYWVIELPQDSMTVAGVYCTLLLANLAGMVMGLMVSAIAPNQNVAPLLSILFLIPQITFGGGLLPVNALGSAGQALNQAMITKWSFESLVTLSGLGTDVSRDPCWRSPKIKTASTKDCKCRGVNLFNECHFPGVGKLFTSAVLLPEPVQPELPTASADSQSWEQYKLKLAEWKQRYVGWIGGRQASIAAAEGLIDRIHQNYGQMFDVQLASRWMGLLAVMAGMGLVLVVSQSIK